MGLGWFVVRPATRTIRSQVDELETRVELRTAELAAALESLQCEIREREQAELQTQSLAAQLTHADRVTTLGHLTSGLAHELNQPLGAIANYLEACELTVERKALGPNVAADYISKAKQAALRPAKSSAGCETSCAPPRPAEAWSA